MAYDFLKFFSTTNKIQEIATKGGLFPTLSTVYTSPLFTEADNYLTTKKSGKSLLMKRRRLKQQIILETMPLQRMKRLKLNPKS
ncbi:hypothetical protein [Fictibacillus solisalsi]|uniref:hypothetical protein n=1 Tax=Fictibacillus solisalsi TaxID=459525 RepID=UPI00147C7FD9